MLKDPLKATANIAQYPDKSSKNDDDDKRRAAEALESVSSLPAAAVGRTLVKVHSSSAC